MKLATIIPTMYNCSCTLLCCFFSWVSGLKAQSDIQVEGLLGNMVSHSINNLSMAGRVGGMQVNLHWNLNDQTGTGHRHSSRRQRYVGCAAYGFDMGDGRREVIYNALYGPINDQLYAKGGEIYSFIGLVGERIQLSPRLDFKYQWGTGASWSTHHFNDKTNPKNLAISTSVNFAGQLRLNLGYKLTDVWSATLGGNISHYSNANIKKPNVGYNIFHANVGVSYVLHRTNNKHSVGSNQALNGIWETAYNDRSSAKHQLGLRYGYRQQSLKQPGHFSILVGEYNHRFFLKRGGAENAIGGNHEWRYGINAMHEGKFNYRDTFGGGSGQIVSVGSRTELAAFARHLFRMGRFDLQLDLGVYLHKPLQGKTQFFNCLGFQYHATKHLILHQRLKAHLNDADYLEWGALLLFN